MRIGTDKNGKEIHIGSRIEGYRNGKLEEGIIYYCDVAFEFQVDWNFDNTFSSLRFCTPFSII